MTQFDKLVNLIVCRPSLLEESNRGQLLRFLKEELDKLGMPKNEAAQSLLNFNDSLDEARMSVHSSEEYVPNPRQKEKLEQSWSKVGNGSDIFSELNVYPLKSVPLASLEEKLISMSTVPIYIDTNFLKFVNPKKYDISNEKNYTYWISNSPHLTKYIFVIERGDLGKTTLFTEKSKSGKKSIVGKEASLFIVGDGTAQKEGLVCYGCSMGLNNLIKTIKLLQSKTDPSKSLNDHGIKMLNIEDKIKYWEVGDFSEWLCLFHSMPIGKIQKEHMFGVIMNAFSSATRILDLFGTRKYVDRGLGQAFGRIREQAKKISRARNIRIDVDKWCPADIYLYNNVPPGIASYTMLSSIGNERGLNSIFASEADEDAVMAVSLKEEKAIQGKSTGFLNIVKEFKIEGLENLPTTLTNDEKVVISDSLDRVKKIVDPIIPNPKSYNIGYLSNLNVIKNDQRVLNSLKLLDNELKEKYKTYIDNFKKQRVDFYRSISKYTHDVPRDTEKVPLDAMIKKTVCYRIAKYVVNEEFFNLTKKKLETEGIDAQSIKYYENPFVALCAYAIGISGMNPTFWKITGNEKGQPASYVKFQGNTVLKTEQRFDMTVNDSPVAASIEINYNVVANIETSESVSKKQRHFSVKISFRFSSNSVQIEVNEFKEKI